MSNKAMSISIEEYNRRIQAFQKAAAPTQPIRKILKYDVYDPEPRKQYVDPKKKMILKDDANLVSRETKDLDQIPHAKRLFDMTSSCSEVEMENHVKRAFDMDYESDKEPKVTKFNWVLPNPQPSPHWHKVERPKLSPQLSRQWRKVEKPKPPPQWHKVGKPKVNYVARPVEVKPVEVKPVKVKPVEVKPIEVKPVEVKPIYFEPTKAKQFNVPEFVKPIKDKEPFERHMVPVKADNAIKKPPVFERDVQKLAWDPIPPPVPPKPVDVDDVQVFNVRPPLERSNTDIPKPTPKVVPIQKSNTMNDLKKKKRKGFSFKRLFKK